MKNKGFKILWGAMLLGLVLCFGGNATAASIAITTPHGGERWVQDSPQTLAWTYDGKDELTVALEKDGQRVGFIKKTKSLRGVMLAFTLPWSAGRYSPTLAPGNLALTMLAPLGDNYTIKIREARQGREVARSQPFSIVGTGGKFSVQPQNPAITMPTGAPLTLGDGQPIRWAGFPSGPVNVNLITPAGAGYRLFAGVEQGGSGEKQWTVGQTKDNVPISPGRGYLIKVRLLDGAGRGTDTIATSAAFEIKEKTVTFTPMQEGKAKVASPVSGNILNAINRMPVKPTIERPGYLHTCPSGYGLRDYGGKPSTYHVTSAQLVCSR